MDENIVRALYGLIAVLIANVVIGWGKSFFNRYKLMKQLTADEAPPFVDPIIKKRTGCQY